MKFPSKKKGPAISSGGPNVAQAMTDAEIAKLDERGLMPIAEARTIVENATVFVRDGADALWAALLSLEDAKEFVRHASRIEWRFHPRGKDNTAFVERYGDAVLEWIAGRVDSRSVLVNFPWCIRPCLLAIGTPAAFDLVWKLKGWDDSSEMVAWQVEPARKVPEEELQAELKRFRAVWMKKHAEVADARIGELADAGDADAKAIALKQGRGLTEETILELLDEKASEGLWPLFHYKADGRLEYFAMRLVVARAAKGDGWGIVFQRLAGSYPEALRVEQFAYGSGVGDPYVDAADCDQVEWEGDGFHGATVSPGGIELDEGMIDEKDLRFGRCVEIGYHPYRVAVIRAVLAADPDAFWPKDKAALEVLGLGKGAKILFVSDSFHHVIGPNGREGAPEQPWEILPSESPVFRSLAKAIVTKDAGAFEPGESNLDWRRHAMTDEPVRPPWLESRFEPPWLASAMKEAAVKKDARGLMPLEEAQAIASAAKRFERGEGSRVKKQWVQGSDRLWAALLSLADGKDLAAHPLEWTMPVRGAANNTAIAERYGSSATAWIATFVRSGVLEDKPGCLRATLLAMEGDEALALLMSLDGIVGEGEAGSPAVQLSMLLEAWLDGPGARVEPLVRRVVAGDERAKSLLRSRALMDESVAGIVEKVTGDKALLDAIGVPRELSPQHVLARLDRAASGPAEDQTRWPRFFHNIYPGEAEYHGMRLMGVRSSVDDGWAVVLERITGYGQNGRVMRYVYGAGKNGHVEALSFHLEIDDETVKGPKGTVKVTDVDARAMLTEPPDYWGGREARSGIAPLRAYVDAHAASMFAPAQDVVKSLGIASPIVITETMAFAHVDGPEAPPETERRPTQVRPSESVAYRSLAAAIATRDPSAFDPGEANTDWRRHAVFAVES